ncbi:hypothetical protein GUJ93_ZPchr0005g14891 [Zizania palustris]|uniref:Uncharacterized protein n=1 Tax=Zizania palustris TaxID=103762 RepID=A0A8J5VZW2_ZIZPA|nr:hypothetical protein GUJ93_ZPchr0005g14891 [Zizania palustris]
MYCRPLQFYCVYSRGGNISLRQPPPTAFTSVLPAAKEKESTNAQAFPQQPPPSENLACQTPSPDAASQNVRLSHAIRQISGESSLSGTSTTQLSGKSPSAISPTPPLLTDETMVPMNQEMTVKPQQYRVSDLESRSKDTGNFEKGGGNLLLSIGETIASSPSSCTVPTQRPRAFAGAIHAHGSLK